MNNKQDLFNMVKAMMMSDTQKAQNALSSYVNKQGKEVLRQIAADDSNG